MLQAYHLIRLFHFIWSRRGLWRDDATYVFRYLIELLGFLGVFVHFTLIADSVGGWKEFIDSTFGQLNRNGESLLILLLHFTIVLAWSGAGFLILVIEQLRFKTRGALIAIAIAEIAMVAAMVWGYFSSNSRDWILLLTPIFFFAPGVIVGLALGHLVEAISTRSNTD